MKFCKSYLLMLLVFGSGLVLAELPIQGETTSDSVVESPSDTGAVAVESMIDTSEKDVDETHPGFPQMDSGPTETSSESLEPVPPGTSIPSEIKSEQNLKSQAGTIQTEPLTSETKEGVSETSGQPDSLLKLQAALKTSEDVYGIPEGMYSLDDKLLRYRRSIEAKMESNRRTGTGIAAVGGVGLVLSGILFAIAADNARAADELSNSGYVVIEDPSSEQYAYAVVDGLFSLGAIVYGLALLQRKPNTDNMQRYYREQYGAHLSRDVRVEPYLAMGASGNWTWGYRLAW